MTHPPHPTTPVIAASTTVVAVALSLGVAIAAAGSITAGTVLVSFLVAGLLSTGYILATGGDIR